MTNQDVRIAARELVRDFHVPVEQQQGMIEAIVKLATAHTKATRISIRCQAWHDVSVEGDWNVTDSDVIEGFEWGGTNQARCLSCNWKGEVKDLNNTKLEDEA